MNVYEYAKQDAYKLQLLTGVKLVNMSMKIPFIKLVMRLTQEN